MNYLFQVRGFVDGGFDYSGQAMPDLIESLPPLSETAGLGLDGAGQPSAHLTRWYSAPNPLDAQLQAQTGGRYAKSHCDGTPLGPNDVAGVRVDGTVAPGGTYSAPLDWNNDLIAGDDPLKSSVDLNYNGSTADSPFSGFDDWQAMDLQQMNARGGAFAFSGGGVNVRGGGVNVRGGGTDNDGAGVNVRGGGINVRGGGVNVRGGGIEQDETTATSTANAPTGLTCTQALTTSTGIIVPGCTGAPGSFAEKGKSVPLTWFSPSFGQTRTYTVWRAVGSFPSVQQVVANFKSFTKIASFSGTPPRTSYIDSSNLKANTTYTYFVTDTNNQGAQSGPSDPVVLFVKF
jgi:hypothetical protein